MGWRSEPATDRQREFAHELGLEFPDDISKGALSDLIDRELGQADPAPAELLEYARAHGVDAEPGIREMMLYGQLFDELPEHEKVRFFVFSVYRSLTGDRRMNLDTHEHREGLYGIAEAVQADPRALKSLLKYAGEDLRFFGRRAGRGKGGSTATIAYKETRQRLQERPELSKPQGGGCLGVVILGLVLPALAAITALVRG